MKANLNIEEELNIMEKYKLSPNELFTIRVLLLAKEEYNEEYLFRFLSIPEPMRGDLRSTLVSLQDKGIILKSYKIPNKGEQFYPEEVEFNKAFLKNFFRASYEMGFEIYSPYIQRELVKRGLSPKEALQNIKDQTKMAKDALQAVVDGGRWITASRAPAWHKFNVLGFKPVFHEGKNILLPPLATTGAGADYDGDCQWGHVFLLTKS